MDYFENIQKPLLDQKICCYCYNKFIANKVTFLLCPYDYVLSPQIRKAMGIEITDTILIIDEAHHVETKAEQVLTKELPLEYLGYTMKI